MCRFIAILTAAVLLAWSVAACFFGLVSSQWWSGPDGTHVGIASNCLETTETVINGVTFVKCEHYSLGAYETATEKWMVALLILAGIIGIICLVIFLFNSVFICCCYSLAGPSTAAFTVIQAILIAVVCVLMGYNYDFAYPDGTESLGIAYYIVISAFLTSVVAAALTGVGTMNNRKIRNNNKAKNSKPSKRSGDDNLGFSGSGTSPVNITIVSDTPAGLDQRYKGGHKEKRTMDIYKV